MKYSVLIALFAVFLMGPFAHAGRMKDVQMEHLEGVAFELLGHYDYDQLEMRGTKFVPALPGFYVALETEVSVYDAATDSFLWVLCTSQFKKASDDRADIAETRCD